MQVKIYGTKIKCLNKYMTLNFDANKKIIIKFKVI